MNTNNSESSERQHARTIALSANVAGYAHLQEREYVDGAPHVKHASLRSLYAQMVDAVLMARDLQHSPVRVLDLGAGSGIATQVWWEKGARVTAVDCSVEMLSLLQERAAGERADVRCVEADASEFAQHCDDQFDVVTLISTLHHVPDYLGLLANAARLVGPGGSLMTFQDPIRYDALTRAERVASEAAYLAWRMGKGNYGRGVGARWRRLRGRQSDAEPSDYLEYHVVRNGVDAAAIRAQVLPLFREVSTVKYWSTQGRAFQWVGERVATQSTFGMTAVGRSR